MILTFLGTGTSHGIPAIGCECAVCRSPDPRNRRTRSSARVCGADGTALQVDIGPEFRVQAIAAGLRRIDAVVLTHAHADHIMGMDDLRRINEIRQGPVPVYGSDDSVRIVRRTFAYAFEPGPPGPTCPAIDLRPFPGGPLRFGGLSVTPLPCRHGPFDIHGFLFEEGSRSIGYFPDCNRIPDATLERVRGIDVMVIDGLRPQPHPTHFSLPESLAALKAIGAKRSYITHLCHLLEHETTQRGLPAGVFVPWDGLEVEV